MVFTIKYKPFSNLNDDTNNALSGHEDDGRRALLGGSSPTIPKTLRCVKCDPPWMDLPYGVLSLQTEEKAGGKVVQLVHTDSGRISALLKISFRVQISSHPCYV